MVKKSEIGVFSFVTILAISVISLILISLIALYIHYNRYTVPHQIAVLIAFILWGIVVYISFDVHSQRAHLENWVYFRIRNKWKFREKPISTLLYHFGPGLLFGVLPLLVGVVLVCLLLLWIICDEDISKFSENLSNFTSVILVLIFMAQAWIFYQQYCHMKQPFFKAPLLWTLSKSNSDADCRILLKNGGNVPIFNISYRILEVLVKDGWVYKKVKSEEISKDFLPRLDGGSEKEMLEKPTEKFREMRLAVYLSAKTLDGHFTRLFFYKAPGAIDFRLAGIIHT